MSITLELTPAEEARLRAEAAAHDCDLHAYIREKLLASGPLLPGHGAPHTIWEAEQPRYQRPAPPGWLEATAPENPPTDGTNGLHRLVGRWPGKESDEEIAAALERLS